MNNNMKITANDFDSIYHQTYNSVLKHAIVRCADFNSVNEIVQDTYIEFYKKIKKVRKIELENITSYIIGIENNILKRYFKNKMEKFNMVSIDSNEFKIEIEDESNLEDNFITKENINEVFEFIKSKDILTLKIFYLYYMFDLKIDDISLELNLNISMIKNRIYRTLKEIKKYLEGRDL